MDIIERLLHLSPDGGSGSLETLYAVAGLSGIACFAAWRWAALRRRRGDAAHES